jgi:hypothetical protein
MQNKNVASCKKYGNMMVTITKDGVSYGRQS